MGLFSFGKKSDENQLDWTNITSIEALEQAFAETDHGVSLFFKHSTRCSISSMALHRFENQWKKEHPCKLYFIDLIAHRDVSNALSELSAVEHESPQVILIQERKTIYFASHNGISANEIQNLI